jgi:hypothetical protein
MSGVAAYGGIVDEYNKVKKQAGKYNLNNIGNDIITKVHNKAEYILQQAGRYRDKSLIKGKGKKKEQLEKSKNLEKMGKDLLKVEAKLKTLLKAKK